MSWPVGRSRTEEERKKISRGVQAYLRRSRDDKFVNVNDLKDYDGLYRHEHKTRLILAHLKRRRIPKENKTKIIKYLDYLSLTCGAGHVYQNARILTNEIADISDFSDKDEILRRYREIQLGPLSDYTKATRVNIIKGFLRWLNNGYPPSYFLKMKTRKKRICPQKNFTLDEVKRFISHCESLEEAAFFTVLWEGNFSVGELLKLRTMDITIREELIELYVEGKDRNRITPILRKKGLIYPLGSYKFLERHLENLEVRYPAGLVWSFRQYNQVQYRIMKIRQMAGLGHVRSHSFRKSRATYNIEMGLGLAETAIFGGWKVGSQCLKEYIIRSGRSMIPKLQAMNAVPEKPPARETESAKVYMES